MSASRRCKSLSLLSQTDFPSDYTPFTLETHLPCSRRQRGNDERTRTPLRPPRGCHRCRKLLLQQRTQRVSASIANRIAREPKFMLSDYFISSVCLSGGGGCLLLNGNQTRKVDFTSEQAPEPPEQPTSSNTHTLMPELVFCCCYM